MDCVCSLDTCAARHIHYPVDHSEGTMSHMVHVEVSLVAAVRTHQLAIIP